MSPEKCQMSQSHRGPFFTITVVAFQSGPGSRVRGKERRQVRYVVGRLCRKCLSSSLVKVKGQRLFPKRRAQSFGLPAEKAAPAMGIAKNNLTPGIPRETGGKPGL